MGISWQELDAVLASVDVDAGPVLFLTGAGISAESGIPTFRGSEGYWKVGSRNYHPQELATNAAFRRDPALVWAWYLYRRAVCLSAQPNAAHAALASLDRTLRERFLLVTQNVDGLHQRAGSPRERTYPIHGDLHQRRCADECMDALEPLPDGLGRTWERGQKVGPRERELLRCNACGGWSRPHVLWFDECYDEAWYRFESALRAARDTGLLVVVGTAGQTNLPLQIVQTVAAGGGALVVVNQDQSPFSEVAENAPRGVFLRGRAGEVVPEVARRIERHFADKIA